MPWQQPSKQIYTMLQADVVPQLVAHFEETPKHEEPTQ